MVLHDYFPACQSLWVVMLQYHDSSHMHAGKFLSQPAFNKLSGGDLWLQLLHKVYFICILLRKQMVSGKNISILVVSLLKTWLHLKGLLICWKYNIEWCISRSHTQTWRQCPLYVRVNMYTHTPGNVTCCYLPRLHIAHSKSSFVIPTLLPSLPLLHPALTSS